MSPNQDCPICKGRGLVFDPRISFPPPMECPGCGSSRQDTGMRRVKGETQVIHFIGGIKRTIKDVELVWENEMCHVKTSLGVEWVINKSNVLAVEIIR